MADPRTAEPPAARGSQPARRLPRTERREQILTAATRAFARSGFAATSLDAVAAEAGVTHVILYRHFASKADLYRSVLNRTTACSPTQWGPTTSTTPASQRCYAPPPPIPTVFGCCFVTPPPSRSSATWSTRSRSTSTAITHRHLADAIPDPRWRDSGRTTRAHRSHRSRHRLARRRPTRPRPRHRPDQPRHRRGNPGRPHALIHVKHT